jgi:hypothetical protein
MEKGRVLRGNTLSESEWSSDHEDEKISSEIFAVPKVHQNLRERMQKDHDEEKNP